MTVHVDGLDVDDEEEATRLMVYHLRLAAMLFEATHADGGQHAGHLMLASMPHVMAQAGMAFVSSLCASYERMALEDEGADNDQDR